MQWGKTQDFWKWGWESGEVILGILEVLTACLCSQIELISFS